MKVKDLLKYDECKFVAKIDGTWVFGTIVIKEGVIHLCQNSRGCEQAIAHEKGYRYSYDIISPGNNESDLEDHSVTDFRSLLPEYWRDRNALDACNSKLELRKWALEVSLNHANKLFPQKKIKRPSEYLSNAHKIIKLVAEDWDKPLNDDYCLRPDRYLDPYADVSIRSNP